MKKLALIAMCVVLVACQKTFVKPEIVYVDKPVFTCPAPPAVPQYQLLTSTLTRDDAKNPGKVAQYYNADIVQLKGTIEIYEMILQQYKAGAIDTQQLQQRVDALYNELKQK